MDGWMDGWMNERLNVSSMSADWGSGDAVEESGADQQRPDAGEWQPGSHH